MASLVLLAGCVEAPIATSSRPTLDFDNLIVPGDRIGPVEIGKPVIQIVRQIGNPSSAKRPFQDIYHANETSYYYSKYQLQFNWIDQGLQPSVEGGSRSICVWSPYWRTATGIHVGSSIQDVINAYGQPDEVGGATVDQPDCKLRYYSGIVFDAPDRNSPISGIYVVQRGKDYNQ